MALNLLHTKQFKALTITQLMTPTRTLDSTLSVATLWKQYPLQNIWASPCQWKQARISTSLTSAAKPTRCLELDAFAGI